MPLPEAITEIETFLGTTPVTLEVEPRGRQAGLRPAYTVRRDTITEYRQGRVHHLQVSLSIGASGAFVSNERILMVYRAMEDLLDWLHTTQPGGMLVYWPSGPTTSVDVTEEGATAIIQIPLCTEYPRL